METTTKKLQKLTKKQKGFVKDYVKTGNGEKSALNNYDIDGKDKENIARSIASQNLTKLNVINAIQSIADKIPDELLEKVHLEGLVAGRKVGEVLEPDYAVRHKYLDTAYKIKRLYGEEQKEQPKENIYNFFFEPKFQQNIRSYDENLKNLILNKDENNKQDKENLGTI